MDAYMYTPFDAEYTFFGIYFFRKKLQHTLPKMQYTLLKKWQYILLEYFCWNILLQKNGSTYSFRKMAEHTP